MIKWVLHFGFKYLKEFWQMKKQYCRNICTFCKYSQECHSNYYCEICTDAELKKYLKV